MFSLIDLFGVIIAGLASTAIFDLWAAIARKIGMTTIKIEKTLGSMFAEGTIATVIGTIMHWLAGIVIALIYAGLLENMGATAGWLVGGIIGLFHALIIGSFVMPMIGVVHPVIRAGKMEAPGFFAVNKGQASPVYIIVGHIMFGSVLGAVYLLTAGV